MRRSVLALASMLSAPSLRLMELTTGLPCTRLRASTATLQSLVSIIRGTFAMSGSAPVSVTKEFIFAPASSIGSSMFMSTMSAPALTWAAAIPIASASAPSFIRRRNLRLPATLHLSPILTNAPGVSVSSPARTIFISFSGIVRGDASAAAAAMAAIWAGVVPQHPPTMLSLPSLSKGRSVSAIFSGVSV